MSVAGDGSTEPLPDGTSPFRRAIFLLSANQIWWVWPSWLRRQIVALKIVGSSPIIHPIKDTRLDTISSLVFLFYVGMMPGLGCCSNFFRYIEFCGGVVLHWNCILRRNGERLSFSE